MDDPKGGCSGELGPVSGSAQPFQVISGLNYHYAIKPSKLNENSFVTDIF
jgi:hypothetical protein